MRAALTATAVLAWILIQVPLVLCHSPCGQTVSAVFQMEGHSCHDERSAAHAHCCSHRQCGGEETEYPPDEDPEDGQHFLVQVQGCAPAGSPELPDAGCQSTIAAVGEHCEWYVALALRRIERGSSGPPAERDTTLGVDRLLI